ncbi:MAG: hypothetical protein LBI36_01255 [Oscillospiraceae bacterium]|jgi:hypothetical protein|nr:hypothetical protein [Oscillospiraceae bacterium]
MMSKHFIDLMGAVDDDFIKEAADVRNDLENKRDGLRNWQPLLAVAACAVIVAGAVFLFGNNGDISNPQKAEMPTVDASDMPPPFGEQGTDGDETDNPQKVDKNELYSELAELREWKSKTEFFFTADGLDFQIVAYKAAIAYLSGDREALSQYLIDPESEVGLTEDSVDLTGEIEYMVFKLPPPDYASDEGNDIHLAVYQFLIKGDDRVVYLDIGLIKNDDIWMVDYIYLQG